jgi:hypothetical protein
MRKSMMDLVLMYGRCELDKYVFDRRLEELDRERGLLLKVPDKGGVVVVANDNILITAYNHNQAANPSSWLAQPQSATWDGTKEVSRTISTERGPSRT